MKQQMKIYIGGEAPGPRSNIFRCRTVPVRERILRLLFGEPRKVTIIVPGRRVETVEIKEMVEEDHDDEIN